MKNQLICKTAFLIPLLALFCASDSQAQSQYKAEAVGPGWSCAQMKMMNRDIPEAKLVCQICRDEDGDGNLDAGFEWCPESGGIDCGPGGCGGTPNP